MVKITALQAINLNNACNNVTGTSHAKFLYAINMNKTALKNVIGSIEESRKEVIPKEYYDYQTKRENIFHNWQTKLEKRADDFNFGEHTPEVEAELKALFEEYEGVLKATELALKEWEKTLSLEVDANVYQIPMEFLPSEIYPAQLEHFRPMVADWNASWDSIVLVPKVMTRHEALTASRDLIDVRVTSAFKCSVNTGMKLIQLVNALGKVGTDIAKYRDETMGMSSKFKDVVVKRNAIMSRQDIDMNDKATMLGKVLESLDADTRAEVSKIEEDTEKMMGEFIPEFKVPHLTIGDFKGDLDARFMNNIFPFLTGE